MSVWQKFKIWLLIGVLYTVYCVMKSTKAVKRIAIPRISWGEKS
jgi:hypothetical protein